MTEIYSALIEFAASHKAWLATALAAIIAALGILSALEAIMKARTAQGAVAWAIVLIGFPPVFVPLYWVFGRRKFRGYAIAKRGDPSEILQIADQLNTKYLDFPAENSNNEDRLVALSRLANLPFCCGNNAELLINGEMAFARMFAQISSAKQYVLLEFYILRNDHIGQRLAELLKAKVAEGVAIYFLYDEIGSIKLDGQYIADLQQAGIHIHAFNSTKGTGNRFQLNFRNHRKILVVDGEVCTIGGMNIGDEYCHKHPVLSPWRDTGLEMRGPVVQAVQLAFLEDWYWARENLPALNWRPHATKETSQNCLILSSGPADSLEACALFFLNMISQARERLWIVSPYFVPDASIVHALQLAAMRGVDVRIMLPEKPDKLIIKLSSFSAIRETLPQGVQFYYYQQGFLHQKVLLVDDDISSIGTANLDNRSLRLNFEITAVIHDRDTAQRVESMLLEDFKHCRQLLQKEVDRWSFPRRLLSRCAYLFAPLQ
ncbi:cardiolipin synthase [Spongiibacter sp. KMU-158]|uniref:Cardiolipin synthase n=1 Tax=Spongiibacter pelagi TaxID=2760804 RepID=A0A927GX97_9GAMM|nr:cardiolipin synthase [Spongiibacter pelagi]MBD2859772.1 cardiolipin synthase [Spongiibacter pelagi]